MSNNRLKPSALNDPPQSTNPANTNPDPSSRWSGATGFIYSDVTHWIPTSVLGSHRIRPGVIPTFQQRNQADRGTEQTPPSGRGRETAAIQSAFRRDYLVLMARTSTERLFIKSQR